MHQLVMESAVTCFVLWKEALFPQGCVHTTHGMRALFLKLYFCCLGKCSQTETAFKTKLPSNEGKELYHFLLHCFDVQVSENVMACQRNVNFLKHRKYAFY